MLLIGLLAGALVSVGNWFSDLMGGGNLDGLIQAQRSLDEFHQSLRETETEPGGSGWFTVMKWGAAAIGLAAATWIVYALFRSRRLRGQESEVIESRESLFSLERVGDDLGEAFGGLFRRIAPGPGQVIDGKTPIPPAITTMPCWNFASRTGRPKESWETPREHQRGLSGILPSDPVASIVDEFQEAHYGAASPEAEQLEKLESSHKELEEFLRRNPSD